MSASGADACADSLDQRTGTAGTRRGLVCIEGSHTRRPCGTPRRSDPHQRGRDRRAGLRRHDRPAAGRRSHRYRQSLGIRVGPALLGHIFDGLLRPLAPGAATAFGFEPTIAAGETIDAGSSVRPHRIAKRPSATGIGAARHCRPCRLDSCARRLHGRRHGAARRRRHRKGARRGTEPLLAGPDTASGTGPPGLGRAAGHRTAHP